MNALTVQELHDKFFRDNYEIVPKKAASVPTRDARTTGPGLPLFGPNDGVRTATPRERGHMTRDDVLEGNDPPQRINRGMIYDGLREAVRDTPAEATVAELDPRKNFTANEPVHAEDLEEYVAAQVEKALGKVYPAGARDALARDAIARVRRRARDQERPCDLPPEPGEKRTTDRALASRGSALFADALRRTQDYAAGLAPARAALTKPAAAPVAKARCSPPEFAALHAKKRA
jgi:hypothetical protein